MKKHLPKHHQCLFVTQKRNGELVKMCLDCGKIKTVDSADK